MKSYIIILLIVLLLVSLSFHYKNLNENNKAIFHELPVHLLPQVKYSEPPVHLFLFFSKDTCRDCLNSFEYLNRISFPFTVTGVVPDEDYKNEMELRSKTAITFKLDKYSKYKKYLPLYGPSLMGVTAKGRILFLIPGIPDHEKWFQDYLVSLYIKAYPVLNL